MNYKPILLFCMILCTTISTDFLAQETVVQESEFKYVRVILLSGDVYDGYLVEVTDDTILIETDMLGKMRFSKLDVSDISEIEKEQIGEFDAINDRFLDLNLQSTRYFYSPSAHQLKKGEGYTHTMYLAYNSFSYGVNDYLTTGVVLMPFGVGTTVKAGATANGIIGASVGCQAIFPLFQPGEIENLSSPVIMGFGNITLGDVRRNISLNYGFTNVNTAYREFLLTLNPVSTELEIDETFTESKTQVHLLSTSAMIELNRSTWLMFEGFYITTLDNDVPDSRNETYLMILGCRKAASKRRMLLDFGGIIVPEIVSTGMILPIPFIGITVPF